MSEPEITHENLIATVTELRSAVKTLTLRNQQLMKGMLAMKRDNETRDDAMKDIEVNISNLDTYSRRNNIEINGIPESIKQNQLETHVLKIFKKLDINLQSYDLSACHRLGKYDATKSRTVIVRFINRKDAYDCLRYGKDLKDTVEYKNVYFSENLCPTNRRMFNYLYKLKKQNKVSRVWVYNGTVCYKVPEDETVYKATHISDVQYYFNNLEDSPIVREDNNGV